MGWGDGGRVGRRWTVGRWWGDGGEMVDGGKTVGRRWEMVDGGKTLGRTWVVTGVSIQFVNGKEDDVRTREVKRWGPVWGKR